MILSTLCYIEKENQYLMLHRTKKKQDINKGKWLAVGGKMEKGESPEECVRREVKEETGLDLLSYQLRGILTYVSNQYEDEYIFVFSSNNFKGTEITCDEGDLKWIPKEKLISLPAWEGDKYIVEKILQKNATFFSMKFQYEGETLVDYEIDEYERQVKS